MSELFESLQFPLAPSSSPSTTSYPLQEVGGSSRGNQHIGAKTDSAAWDQKGRVSKTSLQHVHQPRTPLSSRAHTTSSTLSHYDEQPTTPLFASTSSSRLNRPTHVFWHATPSPSQQIRQIEWQKHLSSSNSPIPPLATQAFREELLQHGGGSAAASKSRQSLTAGTNFIAASDREGSIAGPSATSTSSTGRKFSRRVSRRSMVGGLGDGSVADKSQAGEGMQQLLADLNKHLQRHKNEVDDCSDESLAEELERVFSSQRDVSIPLSDRQDGQDHHDENSTMAGLEMTSVDSRLVHSSPSSSREWSRTKSLPSLAASPRQQGKSAMTKVRSANVPLKEGSRATQNMFKRTLSPSPRPLSTDSDCSAGEHTSLRKSTSEESRAAESSKPSARGKTRSSISPPKKWETRRPPRIGLSRHSLGSSQLPSSFQNGPAAPFKRPAKAIADIPQRGAARDKDVIVIDDSDEDVVEKKAAKPVRRTSPRKKSVTVQQQQQQQQRQQPSKAVEAAKAPVMAKKDNGETDEDTSFDISMDDELLCDALDQAEAKASQEAFHASQKIAPAASCQKSPLVGDESFEMASSDNEALVSAMEAGGW